MLSWHSAPSIATSAVNGWLAGFVLFRIKDPLFPFRASFYLGTHFGRSLKNTRVVYF